MHRFFNHIKRRAASPAVLLGCAFTLFAASLKAAESDRPLVFCSYNLKNWLQQPRDASTAVSNQPLFAKPEAERARAIAFLKRIQPDVLGVCEIGTADDLRDLQDRLKAVGIELPHTEQVRAADATRSLALLSRFPIVERNSQTQLQYQLGEQFQPVQRGFLDVVIVLSPELRVRFVGVHLKSKRAIAEADETLMRRNEAHLLRRHLDRVFDRDPQAQVICYGDFNEQRNQPALTEILGSRADPGHLSDLPLRDDHGETWTHFWDDADVYARLDYFMLSRALRPYVQPRGCYIFTARDFAKASDHRPIVMALQPSLLPRRSAEQE